MESFLGVNDVVLLLQFSAKTLCLTRVIVNGD